MSEDTENKETQPAEEAEASEAAEVAEAASDDAPTASAEAAEESAPEAAAEAAEEPAAEEPAAEEPAAEEAAAAEEPAAEEPAAEESAAEESEAPAAEAPQYDYHALHEMNVAQLREVAAGIEHDAVHGHTTMHKEHLVPAICKALGIEAHEQHEVVGIDKESVKARIRELKKERDEAEAAGDKARLKLTRRRIRGLKRKIRKATV